MLSNRSAAIMPTVAESGCRATSAQRVTMSSAYRCKL